MKTLHYILGSGMNQLPASPRNENRICQSHEDKVNILVQMYFSPLYYAAKPLNHELDAYCLTSEILLVSNDRPHQDLERGRCDNCSEEKDGPTDDIPNGNVWV